MCLQYINDDIVEWLNKNKNVAITQQLNCFCKQAAGLAAYISKKFPLFYDIDVKFSYPGDVNKLGKFIYLELPGNKFVTGIYSQYNYGRSGVFTNYEKMERGLISLTEFLIYRNVHSVGIPYNMGCGLAGGNWEIVKDIIKKVYGTMFNGKINCFIIQKQINK